MKEKDFIEYDVAKELLKENITTLRVEEGNNPQACPPCPPPQLIKVIYFSGGLVIGAAICYALTKILV